MIFSISKALLRLLKYDSSSIIRKTCIETLNTTAAIFRYVFKYRFYVVELRIISIKAQNGNFPLDYLPKTETHVAHNNADHCFLFYLIFLTATEMSNRNYPYRLWKIEPRLNVFQCTSVTLTEGLSWSSLLCSNVLAQEIKWLTKEKALDFFFSFTNI